MWTTCIAATCTIHVPDQDQSRDSAFLEALLKEATVTSYGAIGGNTGKVGQSFMKKYTFCKLETSTDGARVPNVKKDMEIMSQVGEIEVRVHRVEEK